MIFRASQQKLVEIADTPAATEAGSICPPTIDQFLANLKTAWREGEANPTARPKQKFHVRADGPIRWHRSISRLKAGLRRNPGEPPASSSIAYRLNIHSSIETDTFVRCSDG